jgi:DNA-directed RNA polymerase subunit beta
VRDTSLRVPPGVQGTVVEVRVFNRHGVDKDERALAIEREEIERSPRTATTSRRSSVYGRLAELLENRQGIAVPKGFKKDTKITARCSTSIRARSGGSSRSPNDKLMAEIEAMRKQYDERRRASSSASSTRSRSCSAATSCRPA